MRTVEITPEEFGTWDKGANATGTFFPTELLGTSTQDRRPVGRCVKGFDNAGSVLPDLTLLCRRRR